MYRPSLTCLFALALAACEPASAPLEVRMTRDVGADAMRALPPEAVAELWLTVEAIEFRPADEDTWHTLYVEEPFELDLVALPTDKDGAPTLASGELEPGEYEQIRLYTRDEFVVFAEPVELGEAITYEAGVEYEVIVPSGEQSGLKTDHGFTHDDEDDDIVLVFDETATYANITATGNGKVLLAPVLHVDEEG